VDDVTAKRRKLGKYAGNDSDDDEEEEQCV
jgi:hypothetical protein